MIWRKLTRRNSVSSDAPREERSNVLPACSRKADEANSMNYVQVRRMTESDLSAADRLREIAGWNQTLDDWRLLFALEPEGCFVAVRDGEVIGTVTTTMYGQTLAWIGMMLVHPDHRRCGVGTGLMRGALEHLQASGVRSVRLDEI